MQHYEQTEPETALIRRAVDTRNLGGNDAFNQQRRVLDGNCG
jgi:hypothetical protein